MDEAEYVRKTLENPVAAAVKNADKIHNLWEIVSVGNKAVAARYANKAERYYKNKFSPALDNAIKRAKHMSLVSDSCPEDHDTIMEKEMSNYTFEKMRLYSEITNN